MLKGKQYFNRAVLAGMMFLFGGGLFAQNVTISGKVIEEDGETAVEGATFMVEGSQIGGYTAEDGSFEVRTPREDEIRIKFRYYGQSDTILTVVTEKGVKEYNLDLIFGASGVSIGTQVITAGRHAQNLEDVTGSMEVINPEKIDLQASSEIEDVLQNGSGVDIIDGQPNIRGSSGYAYGVGSRVLVMLNGLPLLSPDASIAQFKLIPTDNINQIEIQKGAASVLYGSSALGGVINVITSDAPSKPKTSVRLKGQLFGSPKDPRLDWDGDKGAMAGSVSLFHARKVGRHDLTLLGDIWRETGTVAGNQTLKSRVMAMTKFRPKSIPGLSFGFNGSMVRDSSTVSLFWDSYLPADTLIPFGGDTIFNTLGAYSGKNSSRSQLNLNYTLDPFIKYLTKNNDVHQFRARIVSTSNSNDTQQSTKNSMYYNDYQFTTQFWDERITLVSGATFVMNFANGDSLYGGSHRSRNLAAYSQFDLAATEKLNLSAGARFDHFLIDKTDTEAAPIFRLGANYEIVKGTNVRASFGQAFRSPSIAERFTSTNASGLIIEPNPEIRVEKGWSAELAVRQGLKFGDDKKYLMGFVDVAGFMMDFRDMIEFGVKAPETAAFPPPPPVFNARNVADARITGIEATTLMEVGINDFYFSFSGGVTYIDPVNKNGLTDTTKLVDLLNSVALQGEPQTIEALGEYYQYTLPSDHEFKKWDNPTNLKYRSNWLNRFSATIGYKRFSLTSNYRYKSAIKSVDQFLYIAIPGSADYVKSHPDGFTIVDFILGVEPFDGFKASLHMMNAFNEEWAVLPGIMGDQRSYAIQLKYVF